MTVNEFFLKIAKEIDFKYPNEINKCFMITVTSPSANKIVHHAESK